MRVNQIDVLNEKLAKKEMIYGTHVSLSDSCITEMMGDIGFDILWIDMEHSALDKQEVQNHLIAARGTGAAAFIRVPWNDPVLVKPILEMGPDGIIFPMIKTVEDAKKAVASTTYPLKGDRGFGPRRANNYGMMSNDEYLAQVETSFWRIMQIEHIEAVKNLDDILKVEGIDTIVVGPNDLSGSIGVLGQPRHPEVMKLLDEIGEKCQRAGVSFGVSMGYVPETVADWKRRGCSWMVCDGDSGYIVNGGTIVLNGMKDIFK